MGPIRHCDAKVQSYVTVWHPLHTTVDIAEPMVYHAHTRICNSHLHSNINSNRISVDRPIGIWLYIGISQTEKGKKMNAYEIAIQATVEMATADTYAHAKSHYSTSEWDAPSK
jgi:hypothetical protein